MELKNVKIFNSSFIATEELIELIQEHHSEIETLDKKKYFLNINIELYQKIQNLDMLNTTLITDSGILVGYLITVIQPITHYKHILAAYSDLLYIKPEYRKQGLGKKLTEKTIEALKIKKVSVFILSVKTENEYLVVPKHLGFRPLDSTFYKEI